MKYTDEQLKRSLAKMLPQVLTTSITRLLWIENGKDVLNTELLHLCWLVEESLTDYQAFDYSCDIKYHATWQQRIIALAKVKGIEIL